MMLTFDNPYSLWYKNIQYNYEKMRTASVEYDKVWVVESDTIPPVDALNKLMAVGVPVATGVYVQRHGTPVPNLLRACNSPTLGDPLTWPEVFASDRITVSGGCMGCLLFDASLMQGFTFWADGPHAPDRPFMQHLWNETPTVAVTDVLCGHVKPSGVTLWPDKEKGWRCE